MIDRSLEVEAKLDSLRAVGLWLQDAARDGGLPYEVAFGLDLAVHGVREVDAEERELGIGHRIDQRAHEVAPVGAHHVVLAAERHDRRVTPVACHFGKPIALQSTADHDPVEHA